MPLHQNMAGWKAGQEAAAASPALHMRFDGCRGDAAVGKNDCHPVNKAALMR